MKIALICGGPSLERGISLNSARSLLDHLDSEHLEVTPFYLDTKRSAYRISRGQLYSNTPSDFDFKLHTAASPLSNKQFLRELKKTDIVFPAMHGPYGEDGGIQKLLEENGVPFVGSGPASCKRAFDKYDSNEFIKENGFFTLPSALLKIYGKNHAEIVHTFFRKNRIERAIIKPASGGSSIGVFAVSSPKEALDKIVYLFKKRIDTRVVIEMCATGTEFTTIILQNRFGLPVALPPTEIEIDYSENRIFDFRRKYLPTRQVKWHCPPRFSDETIEKIQAQAEQLFALFKMRDFARFDGWVLPTGEIWFSDFNTVSGMEQNSFLFQQAARIGMTHGDALNYILKSACRRYRIKVPERAYGKRAGIRKPVTLIFGGNTSERQVSLMSGTNVWLKLRNSSIYEPHPYLLDKEERVWILPYHMALNHTVEEITENCKKHSSAKKRLEMFEERARLHLGLTAGKDGVEFFDPAVVDLQTIIRQSKFVFNALHGGLGEDGTLQAMLEKEKVPFNGSGSHVSRLCMDKWETAQKIKDLNIPGISIIPASIISSSELLKMNAVQAKIFWADTRRNLQAHTLIIKPRADGCSSGVVHLFSSDDLEAFAELIRAGAAHARQGTFKNQRTIIEMPSHRPEQFVIERFIETDKLSVKNNNLKHTKKTGWLEITAGVLQEGEKIHAFYPSLTVAEGEVLSVEEKFQGGTGVNLTPPPSTIMRPSVVKKIREGIANLAEKIGIGGYARIDAFARIKTGELLIIEINTLPGLTPSTVLYHQALAETPPILPRELLEKIIQNKGY
ncbi:MAG TPA: hypothetical protein VJH69_02655 [Candidatus Paceibacterota bacterium]